MQTASAYVDLLLRERDFFALVVLIGKIVYYKFDIIFTGNHSYLIAKLTWNMLLSAYISNLLNEAKEKAMEELLLHLPLLRPG